MDRARACSRKTSHCNISFLTVYANFKCERPGHSGSALRILIDGPSRRPGIHFLLRPICCCLLDEVECPRDGDSGWMRNPRLDYLFLIPGSYSKLFGEHLAKLITNPRALKASPGRHEAALPAAPHFNKKGSATESRCFLSIRSHAEVCERSCLESGFGGVHIHSFLHRLQSPRMCLIFLLLRSIPKSRSRLFGGCSWNSEGCAPSVTSSGIGGPRTQMGRAWADGGYAEVPSKPGAAAHFPEFQAHQEQPNP